MFKIEESTIYLTRGDSALIKLTLYDANGDLYTPDPADKIRFAMKKRMSDAEAVLAEIEIPNDTMILEIQPEHTQELTYSTSRPYKYDIELTTASGRVDTFVADADIYILPEVDRYAE